MTETGKEGRKKKRKKKEQKLLMHIILYADERTRKNERPARSDRERERPT